MDRGNIQEGIRQLRKTLSTDPEFHQARLDLALELFQQGQLDKSSNQLKKILAKVPDNIPALLNMGIILLEQGKTEEASKYFKCILHIRPDDPNARKYLEEAQSKDSANEL